MHLKSRKKKVNEAKCRLKVGNRFSTDLQEILRQDLKCNCYLKDQDKARMQKKRTSSLQLNSQIPLELLVLVAEVITLSDLL